MYNLMHIKVTCDKKPFTQKWMESYWEWTGFCFKLQNIFQNIFQNGFVPFHLPSMQKLCSVCNYIHKLFQVKTFLFQSHISNDLRASISKLFLLPSSIYNCFSICNICCTMTRKLNILYILIWPEIPDHYDFLTQHTCMSQR